MHGADTQRCGRLCPPYAAAAVAPMLETDTQAFIDALTAANIGVVPRTADVFIPGPILERVRFPKE
jgi:hypothetical protein